LINLTIDPKLNNFDGKTNGCEPTHVIFDKKGLPYTVENYGITKPLPPNPDAAITVDNTCFNSQTGSWHFGSITFKVPVIVDLCYANISDAKKDSWTDVQTGERYPMGKKFLNLSDTSSLSCNEIDEVINSLITWKTYGATCKYFFYDLLLAHENKHRDNIKDSVLNKLKPDFQNIINSIKITCENYPNETAAKKSIFPLINPLYNDKLDAFMWKETYEQETQNDIFSLINDRIDKLRVIKSNKNCSN
jgi:hypothetical protein